MTLVTTLPAPLQRFVLGQLYKALPPAPDDTPETLTARNDIALLAIASLTPMNTAEALLAVQAIASEAHALSALHEANRYHHDPTAVRQSRAQSAMMTRQGAQARKELRIMQEERRDAERQRQADIAAAENEAEDSARQADEAMVVPFMRRLGQRRRDAGKSHVMGQNPTTRSHEMDSRQSRPSRSKHEAGGAVPDPAIIVAA